MNGRNWKDVIGPTPVTTLSAVRPKDEPRREGLAYQRFYEWREYPQEPPVQKYREDTNDPESPILERDAPWWSERSVGFRAKLLVNPLGGEVRHEAQAYIAYLTGSGTEEDHLKVIADRVIEWEYVIIETDGSRTPVEPPAAGGWDRFLDLPNDALIWLKEEVRGAHFPKETRTTRRAGSTDSPTPSETIPDPDVPAS